MRHCARAVLDVPGRAAAAAAAEAEAARVWTVARVTVGASLCVRVKNGHNPTCPTPMPPKPNLNIAISITTITTIVYITYRLHRLQRQGFCLCPYSELLSRNIKLQNSCLRPYSELLSRNIKNSKLLSASILRAPVKKHKKLQTPVCVHTPSSCQET